MNGEALKLSTVWHMADLLPMVRVMTFEGRRVLAQELSDLNSSEPLHLLASQKFKVENWPHHDKLIGAQIIALMVAVLWVQCGEDERMCGGLVESWPIKDALILAPRPEIG